MEKTFEVKISTPTPEEAAKLRRIIAEVKEEDKTFKPENWQPRGPGEVFNDYKPKEP